MASNKAHLNRRKGRNPLATLAASGGNAKTGTITAPRKVIVTPRVSIARDFTAPRSDMGEYSPVDQRALYTRQFDITAARTMNQI